MPPIVSSRVPSTTTRFINLSTAPADCWDWPRRAISRAPATAGAARPYPPRDHSAKAYDRRPVHLLRGHMNAREFRVGRATSQALARVAWLTRRLSAMSGAEIAHRFDEQIRRSLSR